MAHHTSGPPWSTAAAAAAALAVGRLTVGTIAVLAPGAGARLLFGRPTPSARPMVAMFGARDAALALGLLRSLHAGAPTRDWVLAGAASDALDAVIVFRDRQTVGRRAILVATAGALAAAAGAVAAMRLD